MPRRFVCVPGPEASQPSGEQRAPRDAGAATAAEPAAPSTARSLNLDDEDEFVYRAAEDVDDNEDELDKEEVC